ncbi:double-strand break repair helicase AddA [Rhodobacter capsulatus]|uniref:double-strand break repair helicase AddA n=1 Tax=Rhodobacter capsulatus TaxID=1061 RepID=UPI0006DC9C9A|nr:double-strand break repair helicase AddA [Rhodobacter capsulatus]KQB14621.1 DNA helicase UvrD [Rhodobacter capsulatus]KQB14920.1 DNA helicase UvrD [Rhodobacter capsulatus]PZX24990.1 DNA helicase/exodeoxyribonuclease V subunit A [Rhodobacter capsulatus]QNR63299.1 double-strand break repair helicase AddA [Rhodobacter capsulatus]
MTQRNPASERQVQAADPAASTWLAANAGSGKTKVLTDRVARLLLAGTEPQKVLCLTYTKAAAAEMQNRLLKRLGDWAMLPDADLRAQLAALGECGPLDGESLARARRLFAQAIETPGGLKIQTIHAFCGALLRRFPLEAGVSHGFAEIDDRTAARMREEVLEEIASGPDRPVFDRFLQAFTGADLTGMVAEISHDRDAFSPRVTETELRRALGLDPDLRLETLPDAVFLPGTDRVIAAAIPLLKTQSATMKTLAAQLSQLDLLAPGPLDLARLADLCLVKDGSRVSSKLLTKGAIEAFGPDLAEDFLEMAERVRWAKEQQNALAALSRTLALQAFARVLLPALALKKAQGGWLDFDDLIDRAGALLSDPSVAQWVLFRLDGGIDHILVDEAQDTSPGQWRVIERLADEFTSGDGARDSRRTIFVVGDRKQSIYSFQGADLTHFEAMKSLFSAKFAAISRPLQDAALLHSFRSSLAILRLVDLTFRGDPALALGGAPEHLAFRDSLPGRVDLWPVVPKPDKTEPEEWDDPVDRPGADTAPVVLARAIAAEIRAMVDAGVQLPGRDGPRPVTAGDFLILVQRRSGLFYEIILACKAQGLEVAGADRLKLGGELAVKDIVSVLAFLATPEDDLSLAEALRSPLFGWSEDRLFRLAQPRKGYLWAALREAGDEATLTVLRDLLDRADFLRPYDLIERLLTRHEGRKRLVARLGAEAEEGIDALIAQALAYEQTEVPSLTGFLVWLGADEIEIKRQSDSTGTALRVMTVHGSKGLEAPIVILPDTAKLRNSQRGELLLAEGIPFWKSAAATLPPVLAQAQAEVLERQRHERLRLLYVAMTRAEKWLIVATAGDEEDGAESWHQLVSEGMRSAGTETVSALSEPLQALGPVLRFAHGDWPENGTPVGAAEVVRIDLPDWARDRVSAVPKAAKALSASDLGGPKALPGETAELSTEAAMLRGRQLHLLLEHLPQAPSETWPDLAQSLLGFGSDRAFPDEIDALLTRARQVLTAVEQAGFLGPDTLAEVELTAELPELGGQRLHGIIDRLQIGPDRIRVLDYKSNAVVPNTAAEVPLGLTRQMAAYRAALRQIYPGRTVECFLLWTETGAVMPLGDTLLEEALLSATAS